MGHREDKQYEEGHIRGMAGTGSGLHLVLNLYGVLCVPTSQQPWEAEAGWYVVKGGHRDLSHKGGEECSPAAWEGAGQCPAPELASVDPTMETYYSKMQVATREMDKSACSRPDYLSLIPGNHTVEGEN